MVERAIWIVSAAPVKELAYAGGPGDVVTMKTAWECWWSLSCPRFIPSRCRQVRARQIAVRRDGDQTGLERQEISVYLI